MGPEVELGFSSKMSLKDRTGMLRWNLSFDSVTPCSFAPFRDLPFNELRRCFWRKEVERLK